MKISFSPYMLIGKPPFKNREGALLRVESNEAIGYGDVHPWHELGDKPLAEQLSLLSKGIHTPLTKRSLFFAKIDGEARAAKRNIFTDLVIPASHWLFKSMDEPIPKKYTTVKIKSNPQDDLKKILNSLPTHLKIRIDFNNKHTFESFSKFITTISEFWDRIDFIEDPFPYNKEQWESMPIPLAGDFQEDRGSIAIVKPAVEDYKSFLQCKRIVVTTYLDHPIGQLGAAYTAATLKQTNKTEVCGLLSHLVYERNSFSERFDNDGPNLKPSLDGTGFGYNDLLEKLSWNLLMK